MKRNFFCGLIILITAGLLGCGFHLRGQFNLPNWLDSVYIVNSAGARQLEHALENQMRANGVLINETPASANYWLTLTAAQFSQNIVSVSSSTTPRQYQLVYAAKFKLAKTKGSDLIAEEKVMVIRQVTINNNRILGSNYEEDLTKQEMQREAAFLILNRISNLHQKNSLTK